MGSSRQVEALVNVGNVGRSSIVSGKSSSGKQYRASSKNYKYNVLMIQQSHSWVYAPKN